MSLRDATLPDGRPAALPGEPPYPLDVLRPLAGAAFWMPPGDPVLERIHRGAPGDHPAHDNLVGMVRAWQEHPEWLDFLDPSAPNHADKLLERTLYLHGWGELLPSEGRVLDLGGGVGRFTTALLARGLDVELADPDLRSLWRALGHAVALDARRPGRLDLHWTTATRLPPVAAVDVVVAAEVLCYVPEARAALDAIRSALRPGGLLLGSVEARWGWAASLDVAPGTLPALLSDGVVHVPGDRWIRTFDREELEDLLAGWEILQLRPTHYVPSGPFEAAAGPVDLPAVLELEARLAAHPATRPWHRAWTFAARAPS